MSILEEISALLQQGRAPKVKELVAAAIEQGYSASDILDNGLLAGMDIIGRKFKANEVFVPEVLIAARAMNMGVEVLKPYLLEEDVQSKGVVVIGTVRGDLHDIGKNLVKLMMEGKGLRVVDLGVDVGPEQFVDSALEHNAQIIACSALLTTTMGEMKGVVDLLDERGIREKFKVMIGGAPITQSYCEQIGADAYTSDAASASDVALSYCLKM